MLRRLINLGNCHKILFLNTIPLVLHTSSKDVQHNHPKLTIGIGISKRLINIICQSSIQIEVVVSPSGPQEKPKIP